MLDDVVPHHQVVLVRHGETEWSRSGQHTSHTDIPLTPLGRTEARGVGARLSGRRFGLVLTSPRSRALETCRLAGFEPDAVMTADLAEWDYGELEGRTTADIRREDPGWTLWDDGAPAGESAGDVAARADRVLARTRSVDGDILLFGHGHLLRVLAARWLSLPPEQGRLFALGPASISRLGWEREQPVLLEWNRTVAGLDG
jgi:broad specificity phosphatase PhoE